MPARSRRCAAVIAVAGLSIPLVSPLADGPATNILPRATAQPIAQPPEPSDPKTEPEFNDSAQDTPALGVRPNNNCDFRETPPRPVDTSEAPKPNSATPSPLPVATPTPGGPKLAECGEIAAEGFKIPAEQSASSWAVVDLDSGDVLAAKDPHGRYRPASTIKVLLALVSIEKLPLDEQVTASTEAANAEGSAAGIGPGGKYTVEQLLEGLLMNSGNDCAAELVEQLGGNQHALELINAKAKALGATDTRVVHVAGLDGPGMSSSAYDLSLFYKAAFSTPEFQKIVQTRTIEFPGWGENKAFELSSDNQLLGTYDGAIGGKTGFTDSARHTFYGAAARGGRRLGVIVLDTTAFHGRAYEQAARFLDAGFATPLGNKVGTLQTDYNNSRQDSPVAAATPTANSDNSSRNNAGIEKAAPWALLGAVVVAVGLGMWRGIRRLRRQ